MAINILDTLCLVLAACSLLPMLPFRHWAYRVPGYLALQLSVLLGALLIVRLIGGQFVLLSMLAIILASSALLFNLSRILPYLRISKKQVPDLQGNTQEILSMISCNVYQENQNYPLLTRLVQEFKPDIFIAVETNRQWGNELEKALKEDYPDHFTAYRDDTYGMVVFSRHKLEQEEKYYIYNETPTLSCAVSHPGLGKIRLFVIHPKPPSPTEATTALPKDIEFLEVSKEIGKTDPREKVIVVGDLNDVAWSRATRQFIRDSGLMDPLKGRGIIATFPTYAPILGFPLDQLFVSSHFGIGVMKKLRGIGSDHFPMYYEVGLTSDHRSGRGS